MSPARNRICLIVLSLVVTSAGTMQPAFADDLFSKGGLGSVFGPTLPANPTQPKQPQQRLQPQPGTPIAGVPRTIANEQLGSFLQAAGYQPEKSGEKVYKIKVKQGRWTFPVAFTISTNKKNLWVVFLLRTVDESQLSSQTLLGLMKANYQYGPSHFTYSAEGKRIDLSRALPNINLMPADLKAQVDLLAQVAEKTSDLWSGSNAGQPVKPQQPAKPQQPKSTTPYWQTPAPQQTNNLVGKWFSQASQGVFRLQFNADGTFLLYHKNQSGQESQDQGRYTLNNGVLTIDAKSGTTLKGKFIWNSTSSFSYSPSPTGGALVFNRI